jgi:hypothetical protein
LKPAAPRDRRSLLTAAATLGGSVLLVYAVRSAGVEESLEGIRRVGWGLLAILGLAGLRFVLRATCWRLCMPPGTSLTFGQAFSAFLAGDAVGSVTPLGLLASEPTKVLLTRRHLATREAVTSLAVENLIYATSAVAMVGAGLLVLLATVPLPPPWPWVIAGAFAAMAGGVAFVGFVMRGTWDASRGARPAWRERLAGMRLAVLGIWSGHPGRLWTVLILDLLFHLLSVLEVFITLRWLFGDRSPTLAQAVVFEALNRVVIVAFKFVPFRIGVDEAFSGALAPLLAVDAASGVALAVVRKVRNLFWSAIGLVIVARHPGRNGHGPARAEPASVSGIAPTDRGARATDHRESGSAHPF